MKGKEADLQRYSWQSDSCEIFEAKVTLRWHKERDTDINWTLQQAWVSNKGNIDWRPIECVTDVATLQVCEDHAELSCIPTSQQTKSVKGKRKSSNTHSAELARHKPDRANLV